MSAIRVLPLGAGQDVGGSCVLVRVGGKTVMFDCGMHMGHADARRFPDFRRIAQCGPYTRYVDCLIISHFHLDHCGALPLFTERYGYSGPVFMTFPTKAIVPALLEDFRRVPGDRDRHNHHQQQQQPGSDVPMTFSSEDIAAAMRKTTALNTRQLVRVDDKLSVRVWYGSHVLGAGVWEVRVGSQCVVYTGDYNTTADRHLGAAFVPPRLSPDLLLTESTYATLIRDSKRARERAFLVRLHERVAAGGKVLVPVFALGRAQEIMLLVDMYWERMGLAVPVYYSRGLVTRANAHYGNFVSWMNEGIRETFTVRDAFEFRHVKQFDRSLIDAQGPMVLFATPGMLHGGLSLDVFRRWSGDPNNLVIFPGYCSPNTLGARLLHGERSFAAENGNPALEVRCDVTSLSFSAHVDAKGIVQLIKSVQPRNVMLIHGDKYKMDFIRKRISSELGVYCINPPNNSEVLVDPSLAIPALLSTDLVPAQDGEDEDDDFLEELSAEAALAPPDTKRQHTFSATESGTVVVHGAFVVSGPPGSRSVRVIAPDQAGRELGMTPHKLRVGRHLPTACSATSLSREQLLSLMPTIHSELQQLFGQHRTVSMTSPLSIEFLGSSVQIEAMLPLGFIQVTWEPKEEEFGKRVWIAADGACSASASTAAAARR